MWQEDGKKPIDFTLQINGESQKVSVVSKQKRGGYVVEINEKRFEVDLNPHVNLESFIVSVDGCPYEILGGKSFTANEIHIDGNSYKVSFHIGRKPPTVPTSQGPTQDIPRARTSAEIVDPGRTITAPMPGVILSISVELAQKVRKDDVLMIFEAMKMENRIVSPRDGKIKEIFVKSKDRINRGDPLFVIE